MKKKSSGLSRTCSDCGAEQLGEQMYSILRPVDLVDITLESRQFHMCRRCWDRMVDNAAFNIMRSM